MYKCIDSTSRFTVQETYTAIQTTAEASENTEDMIQNEYLLLHSEVFPNRHVFSAIILHASTPCDKTNYVLVAAARPTEICLKCTDFSQKDKTGPTLTSHQWIARKVISDKRFFCVKHELIASYSRHQQCQDRRTVEENYRRCNSNVQHITSTIANILADNAVPYKYQLHHSR